MDDKKTVDEDQESGSGTSLVAMFKSRYIGYMSLFVVLLISVTIFVHFSFLGVARESYPNHTDLAAFFGYFNGTLMVFSVLIKTFVYGRIMKTWGLKLALVASPILLLIFTLVAALIGGVFGLAASFTMFFLIISPLNAAGDFDWVKDFNIKAEADPSGLRVRLGALFKIILSSERSVFSFILLGVLAVFVTLKIFNTRF